MPHSIKFIYLYIEAFLINLKIKIHQTYPELYYYKSKYFSSFFTR